MKKINIHVVNKSGTEQEISVHFKDKNGIDIDLSSLPVREIFMFSIRMRKELFKKLKGGEI